jgi:hypothetical protein
VIVLWVILGLAGFAAVIIALATGLALGTGALIAILQDRRSSRPDFRQRRRTGEGRSE